MFAEEPFGDHNDLQIYDPVCDAWSTGASMPGGRVAAVSVADRGRIYVLGGKLGSRSNQEYYVEYNSWGTGESNYLSNMIGIKLSGTGSLDVIFFGGLPQPNKVSVWQDRTFWRTDANDLPIGQMDLAGAFLNSKIYLFGGAYGNGQQVQIGVYNPSHSGAYYSYINWGPPGTNMPVGQKKMTAAEVNGKIYVIGGQNGGQNENQIYTPGP